MSNPAAGIIALGIGRSGNHVRSSGWGPAFLDMGSGYDIGEPSYSPASPHRHGRYCILHQPFGHSTCRKAADGVIFLRSMPVPGHDHGMVTAGLSSHWTHRAACAGCRSPSSGWPRGAHRPGGGHLQALWSEGPPRLATVSPHSRSLQLNCAPLMLPILAESEGVCTQRRLHHADGHMLRLAGQGLPLWPQRCFSALRRGIRLPSRL